MTDVHQWLSTVFDHSCRGNVVIEAFGTPGAGKSHFCETLNNHAKQRKWNVAHHSIDGYPKTRFFRILLKLTLIIRACLWRWDLIYVACRAVFVFRRINFSDRLRLIFNMLLVFSVIRLRSKSGRPILMDQGVFQGLWSCSFCHFPSLESQEVKDIRVLGRKIIKALDLELLAIVHVTASPEEVIRRLRNRPVKGRSILNLLESDLISRGLSTTARMLELIYDLAESNPNIIVVDVPA